jgi:hypothetical protein
MNLLIYRRELLKKSVELRNYSYVGKEYEKNIKVQRKQDEYYKKYKFLDGFLKAKEML